MSNVPSYGFLPWARKGIAARLDEQDTLSLATAPSVERANISANLELEMKDLKDGTYKKNINKQVKVIGPGDVLGFNQQVVLRTAPVVGDTSFASNYLPFIEFYEEDFPWRYTPAKHNTPTLNNTVVYQKTRLRPWLTLIVLEESEYAIYPAANGGLPYISLSAAVIDNGFPHQNDIWAFAHVQVNDPIAATTETDINTELNKDVNKDPDVALSRLLSSRKLQADKSYSAFVIPSFETGRLAGLGLATTGVNAQQAAWNKKGAPLSTRRPYHFPVYYQWHFRTGNAGSFASIASAMQRVIIGNDLMRMPMDISDPGFGLKRVPDGYETIDLDVALAPVGHEPTAWPRVDGAQPGGVNGADLQQITKLQNLLNYSSDLSQNKFLVQTYNNPFYNGNLGDDPILVPPIYGVWHSMIQRLDQTSPVWVQQLNLDYRYRAAAGLGAAIVQQNQEEFMHRAWLQINTVNEANKKMQEGKLAGSVNQSLAKKHIVTAGNDITVVMTGAVQHLVKDGTVTVQKSITDSRVPNAIRSGTFRRITRPGNRLNKWMEKQSAQGGNRVAAGVGTVLDRRAAVKNFNADSTASNALRAADLKAAPASALTASKVAVSIADASTYFYKDFKNSQKKLLILGIRDTVAQNKQAYPDDIRRYIYAYPDSRLSKQDRDVIEGNVAKLYGFPWKADSNGDILVTVADDTFKALFDDGAEAKRFETVVLKNSKPLNPAQIKPIVLDLQMQDMADAAIAFTNKVNNSTEWVNEAGGMSNADSVGQRILNQLKPAEVMAKKLASTITVNGVQLKDLQEIMAYPTFEEPVYKYLLELSRDYILPNLDKIPNNAISLIGTNQSFVEAFLAGMNHEMARELLWREYPTDQRGSYFRQFWGVADNIQLAGETPQSKEAKKDIIPMHQWKSFLGNHRSKNAAGFLVLVIRGELLRKYPNTMIYAQRAKYNAAAPWNARQLTSTDTVNDTRFPIFKADIGDDVTLLGFELGIEEAKGMKVPVGVTNTTNYQPGWFFILKERPGQVQFGINDMDLQKPPAVPVVLSQLCWEHLVKLPADLKSYHLTFMSDPPVAIQQSPGQPQWNSNAADLAAILFRDPALFARHASEMLPA
ncbi:hypothetical protein CLV59_104103 [Chitinophaga dinghuensis]|uniref:Uncharacterized protein n=1 Tax=Chitinophaga dinghuensis TaxID=1539050 RepID=A0A327W780_9BACT|nr:hypothetical protein [Chitinophaga dinghuensis]RAJ81878.1 hypothetical protein CLV59_104103 [Chitinophaga dinghuensis]